MSVILPVLTVTKDGEALRSCSVDGDTVLGREEGCAIRLNDRAISRQHALFRFTGNQLQVEKKSEFSPLFVNGVECLRAVLKDGDLLDLGPYQVRVSSGNLPKVVSAASTVQEEVISDLPQFQAGFPSGDSILDAGHSLEPIFSDPKELPEGEIQDQGIPKDASPFENQGFENSQLSSLPTLDTEPSENLQEKLGKPPEPTGPVDENGKTKLIPVSKLSVKLIFKSGTANYTEYEFKKDQIIIGRGSLCDIILNDKKASRKNTLIRRSGLSFVIKDLDSANGTLVNGIKIKEQELNSEEKIAIGGVTFIFKVLSSDYADQEKNFKSLPVEPESENLQDALVSPEVNLVLFQNLPENPQPPSGGINNFASIPGITGIPGGAGPNKSLIERFKKLPKRTQILGIIVGAMFAWWLISDENEEKEIPKNKEVKKSQVSASVKAVERGLLTFDRLSVEQKNFIKTQYELAFNYFKNHDYDRSIYEVTKIFDLIPDYENAREIKRYAEEGKQRMQAIEDERKKKNDEAKIKIKITQLVEDARKLMEKKMYDQAKEMFTQILSIDPDNPTVPPWRKQIEEHDDEIKIQVQQKDVQLTINKQASFLYQEGVRKKSQKRYYPAIEVFQRVIDIGCSDKNLLSKSKKMIIRIHKIIRTDREPVLIEAKKMEESGDFSASFKLYKKATHIDPNHPDGYAGMNRIKGVLHERSKAIYTEAILAESYSDFENAKKMFQECLSMAPSDDIYHERAARKLAHYFKRIPLSQEGGVP